MRRPAPDAALADRAAWMRRRMGYRIALVAVLLLVTFVRVRLREIPLERDEGEYAYAGQLLLEGVPPYAEAYNMKLPGTYIAYALVERAFGETTAAVHLGFLIVNASAIVLVFFLGRRLLGGEVPAVAAAASYALLALGPGVLGTSAHATHFVVLPALGGWLLLLRAEESRSDGPALAAACLFGTAFLMKQHGAFLGAYAWLHFASLCWRDREKGGRRAVGRLAVFTLCLATPFAVACVWLWHAGVWGRFWFWTFEYARQYAGLVPLDEGWRNLGSVLPRVVGSCWSVWLLAGAGLSELWLGEWPARSRGALVGFTAAAAATVVPGLYFRPHYFVTLLPSVALLAAQGCVGAGRWIGRWTGRRCASPAPLLAAAVALCVALVQQRAFWFEMSPLQASRFLYGLEPFPEAAEIGRWLREQSRPTDRIAVLGAEPEIFFHAHRRSATGYIYVFGVWEHQEYAARMAAEMIHEIETARPRFVVDEFGPPRLQEWALRFIQSSYRLAGLVDLRPEGTVYQWRPDPAALGLTRGRVLSVWERIAP